MRLFVAADLPGDLRAALSALREDLRGLPLPVRWVRPEGIHLTFKFLGEVPADRLHEVERALQQEGGGETGPFALEASGVGTFPERGAPRVVWVGVGGDLEAAGRLQRSIDAALGTIGFPKEDRPFKAHLTLGRVGGPGRGDWRSFLSRFERTRAGGFEVDEFVLFESRLGSDGAVYRRLASFPLAPR